MHVNAHLTHHNCVHIIDLFPPKANFLRQCDTSTYSITRIKYYFSSNLSKPGHSRYIPHFRKIFLHQWYMANNVIHVLQCHRDFFQRTASAYLSFAAGACTSSYSFHSFCYQMYWSFLPSKHNTIRNCINISLCYMSWNYGLSPASNLMLTVMATLRKH